jgi:hypothetical protein
VDGGGSFYEQYQEKLGIAKRKRKRSGRAGIADVDCVPTPKRPIENSDCNFSAIVQELPRSGRGIQHGDGKG